jgi:hypothetical protein
VTKKVLPPSKQQESLQPQKPHLTDLLKIASPSFSLVLMRLHRKDAWLELQLPEGKI